MHSAQSSPSAPAEGGGCSDAADGGVEVEEDGGGAGGAGEKAGNNECINNGCAEQSGEMEGGEGLEGGGGGFIVNLVTQKGRVEQRGSVCGGADSARV